MLICNTYLLARGEYCNMASVSCLFRAFLPAGTVDTDTNKDSFKLASRRVLVTQDPKVTLPVSPLDLENIC